MTRAHRERARLRAKRLKSLLDEDRPDRDIDLDVAAGRRQLWERHHPPAVTLRTDLFRSVDGEQSLFQELDGPRGVTQQLLLTMLFEVQCRKWTGPDAAAFRRPLRWSDDPAVLPWLNIVAVPTIDRTLSRTTARPPTERRVAQIRKALDRLADAGRVELFPDHRRRFNRVQLLHEGLRHRRATKPRYRPPGPNEDTITVPAEFWLQGWVQALESNEIVTFLTLLRAWERATPEERQEGLLMPRTAWNLTFGDRGRGHEAYRMLNRFGLIRIDRDDRRRDNGTVRDHNDDTVSTTTRTDPHRFFVHAADALANRAITTVSRALDAQAEGVGMDDAHFLAVYGFNAADALRDGVLARPPAAP